MKRLPLARILFAMCFVKAFSLETSFKTCELIGLSHFRTFETIVTPPFETCLRTCPTVLLKNKWIQISNHGYLNKTSYMDGFAWQDTKIYVIFFDGQSEVPIAYGTNALLVCYEHGCTNKCSLTDRYSTIGVKDEIGVYFKRDADNGNVVFFDHPKAGITMYIRMAKGGFSFGVRLPDDISSVSEGLCSTGCPVKTPMPASCVDTTVGRQVCEAAFAGVDVEEQRIDACIRDVYLWRNVNFSADHRLSALDSKLMSNFSLTHERYSSLSVKNVENFQTLIKPDTQNCYGDIYEKSKPSVSKCD